MLPGETRRGYYHCRHCALIHLDPRDCLDSAAEKAFYGTHRNSIAEPGYVRFLKRILEPAQAFLKPGMRCLDFGCGPGPTLAVLLEQAGFTCDNYDPLFAPDPPSPPYDVIFATEVFEHFHRPAAEVERILALLQPEGLIAVMTELWTDLSRFAGWYYRRDPTHVSFYHAETFTYLAQRHGLTCLYSDRQRAIILKRPCAAAD